MQIAEDKKKNKKRIAVTGKRQITIPVAFFNQLGIEKEVDCHVQDGKLIISRAESGNNGEFAEQILADLIAQGLEGKDLMDKFKKMNRAIRPAVEQMLADADKAVLAKASLAGMSDVFGKENIDA